MFIESNDSVFINIKKNIIVVLYINNILIIDLNKIDIQRIKKAFKIKFHISNLRSIVYYLDIAIKRDRIVDIIYLN